MREAQFGRSAEHPDNWGHPNDWGQAIGAAPDSDGRVGGTCLRVRAR